MTLRLTGGGIGKAFNTGAGAGVGNSAIPGRSFHGSGSSKEKASLYLGFGLDKGRQEKPPVQT